MSSKALAPPARYSVTYEGEAPDGTRYSASAWIEGHPPTDPDANTEVDYPEVSSALLRAAQRVGALRPSLSTTSVTLTVLWPPTEAEERLEEKVVA